MTFNFLPEGYSEDLGLSKMTVSSNIGWMWNLENKQCIIWLFINR